MRQIRPATPIERKTSHMIDGDRLVIESAPNKKYVFIDRRSAVTWPSAKSKGYTAIYGLYDEQYTPIVLLSERKFTDLDKMIDALYIDAIKYGCSRIFADLSDDYSPALKKLRIKSRDMKPGTPRVYDSSEWNDIEQSIPILREYNDNEALVLPEKTQVYREFSTLRPDSIHVTDRIHPQFRFPAYNALSQCAISWELFPYEKQRKRRQTAGEWY